MGVNKLLIFAWATVVALGIFIGVMAYLYSDQAQFDNTYHLEDSLVNEFAGEQK